MLYSLLMAFGVVMLFVGVVFYMWIGSSKSRLGGMFASLLFGTIMILVGTIGRVHERTSKLLATAAEHGTVAKPQPQGVLDALNDIPLSALHNLAAVRGAPEDPSTPMMMGIRMDPQTGEFWITRSKLTTCVLALGADSPSVAREMMNEVKALGATSFKKTPAKDSDSPLK